MYYITLKVALSGIGIIRVFNLVYYNSILFYPPRICLPDGRSICLVPQDPFSRYFRSGGIDLLVPPDRFRGDRTPPDRQQKGHVFKFWPGGKFKEKKRKTPRQM